MGIKGISSTLQQQRQRYGCEGSVCQPSPTGQYANLSTCEQACSDKWKCEDGNCFVHPQGTLTYGQCKATCVPETKYSCRDFNCILDPNGTMTLDKCEEMCTRWTCESAGKCLPNPNGQYLTEQDCVIACPKVTIPCTVIVEGCVDYQSYLAGTSPYTLPQLLSSWVTNLALPQMGGYVVTEQQVLELFQRCCAGGQGTPPTVGASTQRQGRGGAPQRGYSNFTSPVFDKPIVPALIMGMVIGVGLFASYQITKSLKL